MNERSNGAYATPVDETEPDDRSAALENVASYDDGDSFVVCDRKNTRAWIRSDTVNDLEV